jgi:phenylalanyl-tRNA synthetase beta chain
MKVSYNWLKDHIEINEDAEKVAEWLTDTGLEVEHCVRKDQVEGGLQGIVVGKVTSCWQHPNADRLKLTRVDIGEEEELQIVCGAPNVTEGQKVVVAKVNTTLYPTNGDAFKIKKGKIRGEVSMGMLCAEDEIGLGTGHDGIMVLKDDAPVGRPLAEVIDLTSDFQIEIGLTPNRGDAISHLGVARDIRAVSGKPLKKALPEMETGPDCPINVRIEDSKDCPRYSGVLLENVQVEPSPKWLQDRLLSIDVRPINNVVDITNFVLHDLGQPIHAFDVDQLSASEITVRRAKKGEKMATLDEVERTFHGEELLITSGNTPVAIAGVFGGLQSGVTETTNRVFIESAYFNPSVVRKSAKLHGLNTDASFRYERGCDPEITLKALHAVVELLKDLAGAKVVGNATDVYPDPVMPAQFDISWDWINSFCGTDVGKDEMSSILNLLDIQLQENTKDAWTADIPTYRPDVLRPVDVAEEFLRIYGYNRVAISNKLTYGAVFGSTENWDLKQKVRRFLAARGWQEVMNNSQVPKNDAPGEVLLKNPLSAEYAAMRTTMKTGVLQNIAYNINRKNTDLLFFEFGKTYKVNGEGYEEEERLILAATGNTESESWHGSASHFDVYHMKETMEALAHLLHVPMDVFPADEIRTTNKKERKDFDLKQEVILADISWKRIAKKARKAGIQYKEVSPYPEVERDLSVVVDKSIAYEKIDSINKKYAGKYLKGVRVFDLYEGERIEEGKKAVAMRYTFGDPEGTLKDKAIDKTMDRLMQKFEEELNAVIRR